MKLKRKSVYYFFRSFFISSTVLCVLLIFFFLTCLTWQRMQYTSFGIRDAKPIEQTEEGIRILDFYI